MRVGEHPIPTLESLLSVVAGRVPLLLEVKVDGDQWRWAPALKRVVDAYSGPFGIMSFDPRLVRLVKTNLFTQTRPGGQIDQVGQRSAQGVEASLALTLPGGFAVNANGTILDASFDDFAGFEDNTPPGVPEQAANLELSWTGVQGLQLRGDLRYVGRRFSDNANRFRIPAYTVVDLGATYALTDNLALDVRVFNLFDKAYALTTYSDQQRILGRPRSFDVSVRASF